MRRVLLASESPRRRELMVLSEIPFTTASCLLKETLDPELSIEKAVEKLAFEKADAVFHRYPEEFIIGADTIVVSDGSILGKPRDEADAVRMIRSLQGRSHKVYTGVAILDYDDEGKRKSVVHAVETEVFVNPMSDEEIREYAATGEPLDKAGAYGIQGRFAAYIERIDGDYYNVVGLPVSYVYRQLKEIAEKD